MQLLILHALKICFPNIIMKLAYSLDAENKMAK